MRKPKTLEDFPKFIVATVRRGKTSPNGYTRFELEGKFDRIIENIDPAWFWLLLGRRGCVCATMQSLDRQTLAAILTCDERDEPKLAGQTLAYLSPYWQAYQVWMVLDPVWGWERKQFQSTDAVAQEYEAKEASVMEGREVSVWTKLEPADNKRGSSRHYPASDQRSPIASEPRLVSGGWDHEHCDLCRTHINAGKFGYCDPGGRWLCEKCYERYVMQRDLAFVDELANSGSCGAHSDAL